MSGRVRDWQSQMHALLQERSNRPFAWGGQDCALFAADVVQAVSGVDPAAEYRGRYTTQAGAARLIARAGGLAAIADRKLAGEIAPALAQLGDIGLGQAPAGEGFVVCGGRFWLAPGQSGLVKVEPPSRAWRCA